MVETACPTCGETGDGHHGVDPADTFWDCEDDFHIELSDTQNERSR